MFSPQVVELAYIGNRATKTDNVCGTGTVWIGFGDVQKVERKHLPAFLKHPDVWMLADDFAKLKTDSAEFADDNQELCSGEVAGHVELQASGNVVSIQSGLSDAGAEAASTQAPTELKADSVPETANVQPGLSEVHQLSNATAIKLEAESSSAPSAPAEQPAEQKPERSGDQLAAIKNAILSLEQGNPKHFSATNGIPILSAVKNAAGDESVVAADVRAAWAELNGKAV